jgi:hypothetical protein
VILWFQDPMQIIDPPWNGVKRCFYAFQKGYFGGCVETKNMNCETPWNNLHRFRFARFFVNPRGVIP